MKKMFLFAACLAVLACSCSENEEGTVKDVRASLKINANIGAPAVSRAEKTAWEAGDKLGLYVCNGTLALRYQPEMPSIPTPLSPHSAAGWTSEEILLDENEATVFAYYPYDATLTTPSALPVDITTQTDHLYGQGDTKASILNRNVNITMKHALSQVVFRMKKTEGYRQEGVLTGITLKNVGSATPLYTRATMDISTGSLTKTTAGNVEFSAGATLTDKAVSFSSLSFRLMRQRARICRPCSPLTESSCNSPSRPERNGNALTVISTTSYWGITVWSSAVPMAAV